MIIILMSILSHQVSSCAVSNTCSRVLVNPNSAVRFRTLVKEESSSWDTSANLKQSDAQCECVGNFSACIDNLLENKHAEEVPSSEMHVTDAVNCVCSDHGVISPCKPDKSVVFHSSVKLQGMCLNDFMSKINSQIDILLRCRTENVVLSSDINLMFYNFLVSLGFRDFIFFVVSLYT